MPRNNAEGAFTPHFQTLPYSIPSHKEEDEKRDDWFRFENSTDKPDDELGATKIVDYANRKMVLAHINGYKIPFYCSSGSNPKENVKPGEWFPHFGIGSDGWINKYHDDSLPRTKSGKVRSMTNGWGVTAIHDVKQWLDRNVGDIREDTSVPRINATGVAAKALKGYFYPHALNDDNEQERKAFKRMGQVLMGVEHNPREFSVAEKLSHSGRDAQLVKHSKEHPELNLGTELP